MTQLLDNIFWHALSGPQAQYASGAGAARRYAAGFSPFVGFADAAQPDFEALAPHCVPGEHLYCAGWFGPMPAGWQLDAESTMFKMVWAAAMPETDEAPEAVCLGPEHLPQVLALAELTRPGPFGPRAIELGEYFGCFEGERLVAMAGERSCAGSLREISAVCTHPEALGQGYARRLMAKLIRREMLRGETPFLHVMRDNQRAHALYLRSGFADYREVVVRVISRY